MRRFLLVVVLTASILRAEEPGKLSADLAKDIDVIIANTRVFREDDILDSELAKSALRRILKSCSGSSDCVGVREGGNGQPDGPLGLWAALELANLLSDSPEKEALLKGLATLDDSIVLSAPLPYEQAYTASPAALGRAELTRLYIARASEGGDAALAVRTAEQHFSKDVLKTSGGAMGTRADPGAVASRLDEAWRTAGWSWVKRYNRMRFLTEKLPTVAGRRPIFEGIAEGLIRANRREEAWFVLQVLLRENRGVYELNEVDGDLTFPNMRYYRAVAKMAEAGPLKGYDSDVFGRAQVEEVADVCRANRIKGMWPTR